MRTGIWTLLLIVFLFTPLKSRAADPNPDSKAADSPPDNNSFMNPLMMNPINIAQSSPSPAADADMARKVIQQKGKLTIDVYLRAVDANFPGLKGALDQQRIASANRLEKQGVFDPLLSNESGYTRMQNTSKIGEAKYVLFNYPKIELPFRSGIRTFLQYRYNPLSSQSPYIETGKHGEISGGVFVPVMRGLIYNEQSVAEKEAKLGENLAIQTFTLTRLDTLLRSGSVYWSWAGAHQKIKVAAHILELARLVVGISRQQEANGDLAKIYVTEAEEDVERRDADLTQAKRDFQRFSFKLSSVLFDLGGTPLPIPDEINCPEEMPRPQEYSTEDSERSVILALTRRPELKAIDVQLQMAELQRKLAENQMLPALNAVITAGHDGGLKGIGRTYRGQLTFSQPLLMRTARGKLQAAKLRIDKLKKDRSAEEQRIRNEVYDAISAINLSYQRFAALERQVEKANLVYLGERERLQAGDSTVFLVTERERQLNEARMRTIDAQVEYHNGLLALRAITAQM
ncbi:MAG: TolC family protein [Candidatus Obscuribacterales bacterium]|nr:TolC family protein [Candidatus Obscuribacterales bacterium]